MPESSMPESSLAIAIFAYNQSKTIEGCIASVYAAAKALEVAVYIMANGCRDNTEALVLRLQTRYPKLELVSLSLADKAHAWNYYVHQIAPSACGHVFIDGDVEIDEGALSSIVDAFKAKPYANAIAAVPLVGRDRHGWTARMIRFGRISGGLYALPQRFLTELRAKQLKLPVGFIGEDFLVSALAKDTLSQEGLYTPNAKLHIDLQAGFYFRSLSVYRFRDYPLYLRRLLRYRLRDYQLSLLMQYLVEQGSNALPENVQQLYQTVTQLPAYYWHGKHSLIDWLAVAKIRRLAAGKPKLK